MSSPAATLGFVILVSVLATASADCTNCIAKYPTDNDKTCDALATKWADTFSCVEAGNCVSDAGALAGNCVVSQIFELGPTGLNCGVGGRPAVNCMPFKDTIKYNLTYRCSTANTLACEAYRLNGVCSSDIMQKYLNCYWNCAGNEFTQAFYAGACQSAYRITKCDYLEGTANYRQCYGISGSGAANAVAAQALALLLVTMWAMAVF